MVEDSTQAQIMASYIHIAEKIRDSAKKPHIYLACTGAAAKLQYELWQVPGASSFLIGSSFTYASHETDEFIGFKPEGYCTAETAMEMAMASYIRACEFEILNKDYGFPIGVGISASVASTKKHRGEHRSYFAFMTPKGMFCHKSTVKKAAGPEARRDDDDHCNGTAMALLRDILAENHPKYLYDKTTEAEDLLFKRPLFDVDGRRQETPSKAVFLPGAFNPIHDGHRGMRAAIEKLGEEVLYSITTSSLHKPALELSMALHKAAILRLEKWNDTSNSFIFTRNDPLFIDKARQFPESKFILGADALMRMLDPQWGVDPDKLISEFRQLNIEFYVFDRVIDGQVVSMNDIYDNTDHNSEFAKYVNERRCHGIGASWNVSSTELRNE